MFMLKKTIPFHLFVHKTSKHRNIFVLISTTECAMIRAVAEQREER